MINSMSTSAFQFSVRSPEFIEDPYPVYGILRERYPLYFSEEGYWFVTSYDDVSAGLKDARLKNSPSPFSLLNRKNVGRYLAADVANRLIAFLDAPDHNGPRRVITSSFHEFMVAQSQQRIEECYRVCMNAIAGKSEIDFVMEFALPFSVRCIAELFGFSNDVLQSLPYWADMIFHLFHSFPSKETFLNVNDGIRDFRLQMSDLLKDRAISPRDDLASTLMMAEKNHELAFDFIVDNAMLICADAIGNVHTGLTNAVLTLLSHPQQAKLLSADPGLLPRAIDECLRYETPAQYQGRIAGEDMELGGTRIRKNSVVLLSLGAANRDPKVYSRPDDFDILRPKVTNLSFGIGPHRCIGISLVRTAFQCALSHLFCGDLELHLMNPRIKWLSRAGHRWPESLMIKIVRH